VSKIHAVVDTNGLPVHLVRDTGSVLMHAHDGGIDHLHRRIVTASTHP
jgi:hypothetical protein